MLLNHPEAPIAVLGEAMLDIFVSGDVERISPEAPVPVLRHRHDKLRGRRRRQCRMQYRPTSAVRRS